MKNIFFIVLIVIGCTRCDFFEAEEVFNPNAADAAVALNNASVAQIQRLITGLESRHKSYTTVAPRAYGTFGREVFIYFDSDPRFTNDWLGRALPPDANFFLVGGGTYDFPYQAIRHGFFIMEVAANSTAISEQERNGLNGFVKTIQAYQYMIALNGLFENGIRIDVEDVLNPGPFLTYTNALSEIRSLLDEARNDLNSAGSEFFFVLTSGFDGFNTPPTFLTFNRAIATRAAVYAEDWGAAIAELNESFLDLSGNLNTGPSHLFAGPPDTFNPFFFPLDLNSTQIVVVHPSVLNDIETGDNRANKFLQRSLENVVNNTEFPSYVGTHQDNRFASNTDPLSYFRNEELILLLAEARAQTNDFEGAVEAINVVRNAAGLADFINPGNLSEIIDQILFERRFSLWFEPWGHRWIDARRYDRLDEIPTISADETIFQQLAIPQSEINFESQN